MDSGRRVVKRAGPGMIRFTVPGRPVAKERARVPRVGPAYTPKKTLDYDRVPACVYCQPQVATVGLTEAQAREKGKDVAVGKVPFVASGKAVGTGHTEGFVKLVADARYGEILGCQIIGADATELIARHRQRRDGGCIRAQAARETRAPIPYVHRARVDHGLIGQGGARDDVEDSVA